jgi:hypothetical protein
VVSDLSSHFADSFSKGGKVLESVFSRGLSALKN